MTARETTLGALTAADLGKWVVTTRRSGALSRLMFTGRSVAGYARDGRIVALGRLDTPVTVYDECVPDRPTPHRVTVPCHMTFPRPPHKWDREDRTRLRWECPGVQHNKEET